MSCAMCSKEPTRSLGRTYVRIRCEFVKFVITIKYVVAVDILKLSY